MDLGSVAFAGSETEQRGGGTDGGGGQPAASGGAGGEPEVEAAVGCRRQLGGRNLREAVEVRPGMGPFVDVERGQGGAGVDLPGRHVRFVGEVGNDVTGTHLDVRAADVHLGEPSGARQHVDHHPPFPA